MMLPYSCLVAMWLTQPYALPPCRSRKSCSRETQTQSPTPPWCGCTNHRSKSQNSKFCFKPAGRQVCRKRLICCRSSSYCRAATERHPSHRHQQNESKDDAFLYSSRHSHCPCPSSVQGAQDQVEPGLLRPQYQPRSWPR